MSSSYNSPDPRIYKCAVAQSLEEAEYVLDVVKYAHCPDPREVLTPDVDAPISSLDQCLATRRGNAPPPAPKPTGK